MYQSSQVIVLATIIVFTSVASEEPQQVHLSLGRNVSEMIVTWSTRNLTSKSVVEYSFEEQLVQPVPSRVDVEYFHFNASGFVEKFVNGEKKDGRVMYIHRVILRSLRPSTRYFYRVGSREGWSDVFLFDTLKTGVNWSPRIALFGDFGYKNDKIHELLRTQVSRSAFDLIIHLGDIGYDLHSNDGRTGDMFLEELEEIAAYVPYQTVPGNHESAYNFSNYDARFTMMNSDGIKNNHFYSFNVGPIHFVAFSTEYYFFDEYGTSQIGTQYAWLENDLREANKPDNRKLRPWIITLCHRPMYCSMNKQQRCGKHERLLRRGYQFAGGEMYGLEELFHQNGVDLLMSGHDHVYERSWPIYDGNVYNGSTHEPYTNATAGVHFIIGTGGSSEGIYRFEGPNDLAAARFSRYGLAHLTAHNETHLTVEQYSDDLAGTIIDKVTIIKHFHGPYHRKGASPTTRPSTEVEHSRLETNTIPPSLLNILTPSQESVSVDKENV